MKPCIIMFLFSMIAGTSYALDTQGLGKPGGEQAPLHAAMASGVSEHEAVQGGVIGIGGSLATMLDRLVTLSGGAETDHFHFFNHSREIAPDLIRVFLLLSEDGTAWAALANILLIACFFAAGYGVERLFTIKFIQHRLQFGSNGLGGKTIDTGGQVLGNLEKFTSTLITFVPELIGLLIFSVVSSLLYALCVPSDYQPMKLLFVAALMAIGLTRVCLFVSHIVFSPYIMQFRLWPMECGTAVSMHKTMIWPTGFILVSLMVSVLVYKLGARPVTVQFLQLSCVTLLLLASGIAIIRYRKTVKNRILFSGPAAPTWTRLKFAEFWHLFALAYVFMLWLLALVTTSADSTEISRGAFIISFFIVPIWLLLSRLEQWIVERSIRTLKIYDPTPSPNLSREEFDRNERGKVFLARCRNIGRVLLFAVFCLWLASLWGLSVPFVSRLTGVFFQTITILSCSLIFWQVVSSWIERKIAESLPDEKAEDQDDEWGGAANRGRSYTLLPMVRKFIGSSLIVIVTMTVLSSMGVDIGPLLAGAGVVGLAVGFGAQKLVADMFSGFFFLLDDAFRVGEYLEAGSVSGIVENITLRSVMLRHHRGMLQIVPHSELGPITNFMRGGIVVKFNLDFPYDADIDKIRKVIKKVGQAMLENDEFGRDFIRPLKSQGVREISNSVMTIRVKFTAKPGAHFVIRREAFKRITEALAASGINYAHKKVIVDLPPVMTEHLSPEQAQVAGAAAMRAIDEDGGLKALPPGNSVTA